MVGCVIVAHGGLGAELVKVAEVIVGRLDRVEVISVGTDVDVETSRNEISAAIRRVQDNDGVLIFTDMFGGTPANLSLAFLNEKGVEVITGVNLPMLIKYANHRKDKGVTDLALMVREGGVKSIIMASEMLGQKTKKQ